MVNKLNELEQKLQQLFDYGEAIFDRTVFNVGLEFGKELQRQERHDYECVFWKELDRKLLIENQFRNAVTKITGRLRQLVCKSILDHLRENSCWRIARRDLVTEFDEFSAETLEKHCVQIIQVDKFLPEGDFECTFKVTGRLENAFAAYGFHPQFNATVLNKNGGEAVALGIWDDIGLMVSKAHCHIQHSKHWSPEQLTAFYQAIRNVVALEKA